MLAVRTHPGCFGERPRGSPSLLRNRIARVLIVGLGLGVMFAAVDDVALVFLARDELGAGALGYGALASIYGVGFAAGSIALRRARLARAETAFVAGLFLTGVGGLLTGLAPVLAVAALTQAVAGSGNGLDVVATDTLVQREIPRSHRGRVFGVVASMTLLGAAIGRGLGGIVLDSTSARATFVIGGSGVLMVTLVALASSSAPTRRRAERPLLRDPWVVSTWVVSTSRGLLRAEVLTRAVAERQRREEMLTPLTLTSGVSHRCKRRAPPLRYGNVTAGTTGLRLDEVQTQPAESRTWVAQTAVTRTIGWPGLLARVDLISNLTTAGTVLSCSKSQVSMFAKVRSPPCPSRQLHPWWSRGIAHSPRPPRPRASMSLRLSEPRGRRPGDPEWVGR